MTVEQANTLLNEMINTRAMVLHSRSVQVVMEAFALHFSEEIRQYSITGLLHDADYELAPQTHPDLIVRIMEQAGERDIAHAIAGHNTEWNVPRISNMDKAIVAADKMTGFVTAVIKSRPQRFEGLTARPVLKKMKNRKFAVSVSRDEIQAGADLLGWEVEELANFVIEALRPFQNALELTSERA